MDIQINSDGLLIVNGDFVVGNSELQEVKIIVEESPGNIRKEPFIGANAYAYLNGEDLYKLKNEIFYHCKLAGNNIKNIKLNSENEIEIICQKSST